MTMCNFKVRGRLLIDYVYQDVKRDAPLADYKTSNVRGRQAFLGIEGKLNNYIATRPRAAPVNGGAWAGTTWSSIQAQRVHLADGRQHQGRRAGEPDLDRFISFMDRGP